jgi:flagellar hook-basal body complex protein FliE
MSIPISPHGIPSLHLPDASAASGTKNASFRSVLESTIDQVEQSRANADASAKAFVSGDGDELHSVALATQRAELEFDLLLQIRNKVVSAYQEVMRMQV